MSLSVVGGFYRKEETEKTEVNLPNGSRKYTFLHFYYPMVLDINGRTVETTENACIIFAPGTPQNYKCKYGEYILDYVKFEADENVFYNNPLPYNEIFYIESGECISEQMKFITWALTEKQADHESALGLALLKIYDICKAKRVYPNAKDKRDSEISYRLFMIRKQVRENPEKWTVNLMAENFYLSRSHFTTLYKNHFGVSPTDDIHAFIDEKAKKLLKNTDFTVNEIASLCGFSGPENFIRSFKKINGVSPLKYRTESSGVL